MRVPAFRSRIREANAKKCRERRARLHSTHGECKGWTGETGTYIHAGAMPDRRMLGELCGMQGGESQTAFVFPGQGAQKVGMGQDLAAAYPAAREVFEAVDDALGQNLSELIRDGSIEQLTLTENAQPALMATSLAVVAALAAEGVPVTAARFVAGHSLGEYSALCAAGALDLGDAARLLRERGAAMQAAVPVGEGAMAAIIGLDFEAVLEVALEAARDEVCAAANDNDPRQVVVSGNRAAVERAVEIAKRRGARRAILLPVSAPFHCILMTPARDRMVAALESVTLLPPSVPVVTNVTAAGESDPDRLRALLVEQITAPVRWRESVAWMSGAGIARALEIGAGAALSGMIRRIDPAISCRSVHSPEDVAGVAEALAADRGTER